MSVLLLNEWIAGDGRVGEVLWLFAMRIAGLAAPNLCVETFRMPGSVRSMVYAVCRLVSFGVSH